MPTIASAEWAAGYGWDVLHDRGAGYGELRYIDTTTPFFHDTDYALGWSAFLGTRNTVGVELFYPYKKWEIGFGVEYSDEGEDVVETAWKYEVRVGYLMTEQWSVQWFHKSNCRDICSKTGLDNILPHGPDDKSNRGFNYVGLMYRW